MPIQWLQPMSFSNTCLCLGEDRQQLHAVLQLLAPMSVVEVPIFVEVSAGIQAAFKPASHSLVYERKDGSTSMDNNIDGLPQLAWCQRHLLRQVRPWESLRG